MSNPLGLGSPGFDKALWAMGLGRYGLANALEPERPGLLNSLGEGQA